MPPPGGFFVPERVNFFVFVKYLKINIILFLILLKYILTLLNKY